MARTLPYPPRPAERVGFAGAMAYGGNLSLTRLAHATWSTLGNKVNWYFSLESIRPASTTARARAA